jgi:hypothetical protein
VDSLHIQCFILKNDQNFKSSPKIKFLHFFILLYFKLEVFLIHQGEIRKKEPSNVWKILKSCFFLI